jgi:hypothetical protein
VRAGQEGVDTHADDETALDLALDATGDDRALLALQKDVLPVLLLLGHVVGQDGAAVLVLELHDEDFDRGTDLELAEIEELMGRDDALGLAADVDNDLVLADFGDGAGDDGAFLQAVEGGVRQQLLHYAAHGL